MVNAPPTQHIAFVLGVLAFQGAFLGSTIIDEIPDLPDINENPDLGEALEFAKDLVLFPLEIVGFMLELFALEFSGIPQVIQLPLGAYNVVIMVWTTIGFIMEIIGNLGQVIPLT